MNPLVKTIIDQYWAELKRKPNIIGYSHDLKNRQKNGVLIPETQVFRIYVKQKIALKELNIADIIPEALAIIDEVGNRRQVSTDIYYLGEQKALSVDKTAKFRPVELGTSISHWEITAGSLGLLYKDAEGNVYAGSNAHVLTPDPSLSPEEIIEKRIVQPGTYHAGQTEENIVGTYYWHQRIIPIGISTCPIGTGFASLVNFALKLFKRHGRLAYQDTSENNIDFAVYKPTVEHVMKVADASLTDEPFIGLLFAGSDTAGILCKAKYMIEKGYTPLLPTKEINDGDTIKGCSFWCNFTSTVIDSSASLSVNYGSFTALFSDIIVVANDGTIRGGWSGSSWRFIK